MIEIRSIPTSWFKTPQPAHDRLFEHNGHRPSRDHLQELTVFSIAVQVGYGLPNGEEFSPDNPSLEMVGRISREIIEKEQRF